MKAGSKNTLENMFSSARHIASAAGLIAISYFGAGCDSQPRIVNPISEQPCPSLRRAAEGIQDTLRISVPGTNYSNIVLTDANFPSFGLKPAGNPESVIGYTPVTVDVRDLGTDALVSNPVIIYYNRTNKTYTSTNGSVVIDNKPTAIRETDPCLEEALSRRAGEPDPLVLPSNVTVYTVPWDSQLVAMAKRYYASVVPERNWNATSRAWPYGYPAKVAFVNQGTMSAENLKKLTDVVEYSDNLAGMNFGELTDDSTQAKVVVRLNAPQSWTVYEQNRIVICIAKSSFIEANLTSSTHEYFWHTLMQIRQEGFASDGVGSGSGTTPSQREVEMLKSANIYPYHNLSGIFNWGNISNPENSN